MLAFLDKGLSFTAIGILVGIREIGVNLMEIPSGAIADVWGRKRSLMFSLLCYIVSFCVFGFAQDMWLFIPAMILYGAGEAFRTGTHKAMLFAWLTENGLQAEKKRIYGVTRSWGKIGAAFSLLPASALVFYSGDYALVFYLSTIPFALNALNIASYPSYLNASSNKPCTITGIVSTSFESFRSTWQVPVLRSVILECMCYETLFKLAKDYVQPAIKIFALSLPFFVGMEATGRSAVCIAVVYFFMELMSAYASRKSGTLVDYYGEGMAAKLIWSAECLFFSLAVVGVFTGMTWLTLLVLVAILIKQNLWKPILVCRCSEVCEDKHMATVLSIQSQAKSVLLAIVAPLLGWAVDSFHGEGAYALLPIWCFGLLLAGGIMLGHFSKRSSSNEM